MIRYVLPVLLFAGVALAGINYGGSISYDSPLFSGGNVSNAITSKVASGSDAVVLQQGATIQCSEAGGLDDTEIWASGASTLNVSASGGTTVLSGGHTFTTTNAVIPNANVQGNLTVGGNAIFSGALVDVGATCSAGQFFIDTGGATQELCVCTATNTIRCVAITAGPAN